LRILVVDDSTASNREQTMRRRTFLMLAAVAAGGLAGCGGEAAHVSAGALQPDPETPGPHARTAPPAQHDAANAGMMDATPPAGRRRAD
jgi:hypothetical protein